MPLTNDETAEIKRRLGYTGLTVSARPYFEIAQVFETVVQTTLNEESVPYIRTTILPAIHRIETQIDQSLCRVKFDRADEVTVNKDEFSELRKRLEFWLDALSKTVGVQRANHGATIGAAVEVY